MACGERQANQCHGDLEEEKFNHLGVIVGPRPAALDEFLLLPVSGQQLDRRCRATSQH